MQIALKKAGYVKAPESPWNPSKKAIARVRNPLPVPICCPNCGEPVDIVNHDVIYGRSYGDWPWAYRCSDAKCDSHVGMHPYTNIPLGTIANATTRNARKIAKNAFNPRWQNGNISRKAAYAWLAAQLGISNVEECHIGWFDTATCARVRDICSKSQL